ncbi:MAG TPA: BRCT domain-containing protein [Fluviicoccus sp.]|nr:BRCT domain-containing protein [Fluviicoccus sp.]
MEISYGRIGMGLINEFNQSLSSLLGIATGLLADGRLHDSEITFLNEWLKSNHVLSTRWPGDVIYSRVQEVLADGVITEDERAYLVDTLRKLTGSTLEELATSKHPTQLIEYEEPEIVYFGSAFCLTGDFVYGFRALCESLIVLRGGEIKTGVSKKLTYLVVGGIGSPEWKHGSYGTKIDKAMEMKKAGATIQIVHEEHWLKSLS